MSYLVVTPARNEEDHLGALARSMAAQTRRPAEWVVVDDGSSDTTGELVDRFAGDHEWVTAVHRPDRGHRAPGGGVAETFNAGLAAARTDDWDYVVKLDADLELDPDYFARCLRYLETHDDVGIIGGLVHDRQPDGSLAVEKNPTFHVRGATKIYRRATWEAIGGLVVAKGWDTIDELKANQLGWRTMTLSDVAVVQQRTTGARAGTWRDWAKNGRAAHFCGYHPLFIVARAGRVAMTRPFLVRGVALFSGWLSAVVRRRAPIADPELIGYVRRQQINRLSGRPTIWR